MSVPYGVAVDVPEPYAGELRQWRKRVGDDNADAIPPHITLLPPTELTPADLPAIEEHLEAVALSGSAFDIHLKGTGTFRPVSPVVFVALVEGISDCERLERRVRTGPLARPVRFNYHPHVTVAHEVPDDALDEAFAGLATYEAKFRVDGFTMFEQGMDGVWRPCQRFSFAR